MPDWDRGAASALPACLQPRQKCDEARWVPHRGHALQRGAAQRPEEHAHAAATAAAAAAATAAAAAVKPECSLLDEAPRRPWKPIPEPPIRVLAQRHVMSFAKNPRIFLRVFTYDFFHEPPRCAGEMGNPS